MVKNIQGKYIPGFEGYYSIDKNGNVFSCRYNNKIIKDYNLNKTGYRIIRLNINNKKTNILVHRAVALTYLKNPFCLSEINHKNGIKNDNRLSNLEWTSRANNIKHAYKKNLIDRNKKGLKGSSNVFSKLTEENVIFIRNFSKENPRKTHKEISYMFNITSSNVSYIIKRKTWKHI